MSVKKAVNRPRKEKGPKLEIRKLIKKLGISGNIQISRRKTWFSEAMEKLDKETK